MLSRREIEGVRSHDLTIVGPAKLIKLPYLLLRAIFAVGDFAGLLGWRPPARTTPLLEMRRGAVGDPGPWIAMTDIKPAPLRASLLAAPAGVHEKWFAKLYLLKPVVFAVVSSLWIATAFVSLGPGWQSGIGLMK